MIESIIEIFIIDPLMWHKWNFKRAFKKDVTPERSDKPWSTIIYALNVLIVGCIIQFVVMDNWFWSYAFLALTFRVAFFNPIINLSNVGKVRMPIDYLSNKGFDKFLRKIPFLVRTVFGLILFVIGVMQYLYLSGRIYQDYSIIFDLPIFPK